VNIEQTLTGDRPEGINFGAVRRIVSPKIRYIAARHAARKGMAAA
jgi:hypothetical protein